MGLLQTLRPDWWFSAHLHVRFEAVVKHGSGEQGPEEGNPHVAAANPEEIVISDEDMNDENSSTETTSNVARGRTSQNPDEITLVDDDELIEPPPPRPINPPSETKFIALDKCLPRRDFLEVFCMDV